jgi:hypothetical protein
MANPSVVNDVCTFAPAGTYGHECGRVATVTAVKRSSATKDGIYYAARCERCAAIKGGENALTMRFEARNPAVHVNRWV